MKKVITRVVQEHNNDLAIAFFNPAPNHAVNFEDIKNTLVNFLTVQHDFPYTTIQCCPYGQAYVRFAYHHHRDFLIHGSPHQVGGGSITFIPHNRAWNNRTSVMTHEVWLMILGLNVDFWTHHLVDKAVSEFGRLLAWEEDQDHLCRILVRARVSSLDSIPWFLTFAEGDAPESQCWYAQCEVLQATSIGAMP